MNRTGSRCTPVVLVALLLLGAAACFQVGNTTSVTVDAELPAPWGAVTIGEPVPVGYGWD
jgi:hypothetical protein